MPTTTPAPQEIAAALTANSEPWPRPRAASWLLSRQRSLLGNAEFRRRVLYLEIVDGELATAAVDWFAAAAWMLTDRFQSAPIAEQALYRLTVALVDDEQPVQLGELLVDLDEDALRDALAAMAWAAGYREVAHELGRETTR